MTFVKPFIMCLAARLVTTLSRLPSRLSWRLPSCLLSCESSPLKSSLVFSHLSRRACGHDSVAFPAASFLASLVTSLVTHESSALAPRLLSHLSSRLWSNLVTSLLARLSIWLFLFFVYSHVSGGVSRHVSGPAPLSVSCHVSLFLLVTLHTHELTTVTTDSSAS